MYDSDMFRERRKRSQEKRRSNRENSAKKLEKFGIPFTIHNAGAHLIVMEKIDFWPGTGRWTCRETKTTAFGVMGLIRHLGFDDEHSREN